MSTIIQVILMQYKYICYIEDLFDYYNSTLKLDC
jgi:hypothetical protein